MKHPERIVATEGPEWPSAGTKSVYRVAGCQRREGGRQR